MAQNSTRAATRKLQVRGEPILHPGRAADPVPPLAPADPQAVMTVTPEARPVATAPLADAPMADAATAAADEDNLQHPDQHPDGEPESPDADAEPTEESEAIEQAMAEARQRKFRLMLKQCDRVLLMDFDLLAMSGWPDNYSLAAARKNRDLWVFSALIAALVFLSGLTGFVPAWVAGGGFGAFMIILMLGVPTVRRIYTSRPSYLDLIMKRQRLLRDARKHVEHLEGNEGLVWQCARMADFNASLRSSRFSDLVALSEHRALAQNMTRREYIRLYLIYLLEAEKAYDRLQKAFFDGHQEAIDRGWASVATSPGQRA